MWFQYDKSILQFTNSITVTKLMIALLQETVMLTGHQDNLS